VNLLHQHRQLH